MCGCHKVVETSLGTLAHLPSQCGRDRRAFCAMRAVQPTSTIPLYYDRQARQYQVWVDVPPRNDVPRTLAAVWC